MSHLPDYFNAPPETDPAPVRCPMCRSAEDCGCGNDEGAADPRAEDVALAQRGTSGPGAAPGATVSNLASPFCTRCLGHHARDGEAEERCQEVSRFVIADHRRRGGEG